MAVDTRVSPLAGLDEAAWHGGWNRLHSHPPWVGTPALTLTTWRISGNILNISAVTSLSGKQYLIHNVIMKINWTDIYNTFWITAGTEKESWKFLLKKILLSPHPIACMKVIGNSMLSLVITLMLWQHCLKKRCIVCKVSARRNQHWLNACCPPPTGLGIPAYIIYHSISQQPWDIRIIILSFTDLETEVQKFLWPIEELEPSSMTL